MGIKEYRQGIWEMCKFEPLAAQAPIFESEARFKLIAGGDRSGKSKIGAMLATEEAPRTDLVWLVANEYELTRKEFEYSAENFTMMKLLDEKEISFPQHGPASMKLKTGCRVVTKSALDVTRLVMEAPGFILICEAAMLEFEAFQRLLVRAAEKRARVVATGSFEGSLGWYPDYYNLWSQYPNDDDAQSFSIPSWTNTLIFPGGRDDPEIKRMEKQLSHERFMERCAAVPCKPSGIVLPEFDNRVHVGTYEFDKECPVYIAVDPGYGAPGAYAIEVAQFKEGAGYLIDEIYEQNMTTEDIITVIKKRPWYPYCREGAIDIAAKQHHGTRSALDAWIKETQINLRKRSMRVEDGIDLLRTWLKIDPITRKPKLYVSYKNKGFIAECGGGKSPVFGGGVWLRHEITHEPMESNCHGTKAVMYLLAILFGWAHDATRKSVLVQSFY